MTPDTPVATRVADVIAVMERIAPPHLAEEWDNCGLQVGSPRWPVRSVRVSLDPLPSVVQSAVRDGVDMLVTHHPLILRPLRAINVESTIGRVIEAALQGRMALYCAHTNLDSAREGVNQVLARTLGLQQLVPMIPPAATNDGSAAGMGMGRIGRLEQPMSLRRLAEAVRQRLGLHQVRVAGDPDMMVQQAAVCSGSGSGLLAAFFETGAEVYISGDLRYHDARDVEAAGRGLIDVGHFASEHLIVEPLAVQLRHLMSDAGRAVRIDACALEQDPFYSQG